MLENGLTFAVDRLNGDVDDGSFRDFGADLDPHQPTRCLAAVFWNGCLQDGERRFGALGESGRRGGLLHWQGFGLGCGFGV